MTGKEERPRSCLAIWPASLLSGYGLITVILIFCVIGFDLTLFYHFLYRVPPGIPRGRIWTFGQYLFCGGAVVLFIVQVVWG